MQDKLGQLEVAAPQWAAGMRNQQAAWAQQGIQAPAMPGDVSKYLPPPITVNIDARGANPTETQKAVEDAWRTIQREQRWAPTG